jgi:hypothetical protein
MCSFGCLSAVAQPCARSIRRTAIVLALGTFWGRGVLASDVCPTSCGIESRQCATNQPLAPKLSQMRRSAYAVTAAPRRAISPAAAPTTCATSSAHCIASSMLRASRETEIKPA